MCVYIVAILSLPSIPRSILLYGFRTLLNKSVYNTYVSEVNLSLVSLFLN